MPLAIFWVAVFALDEPPHFRAGFNVKDAAAGIGFLQGFDQQGCLSAFAAAGAPDKNKSLLFHAQSPI